MSALALVTRPVITGTIRSRLLVNAVVDPDEAATRLPPGLRPHATELGTVVGYCLLELADVRPAPAPGFVGVTVRAAAHRISVEWDDEFGQTTVGVYVPIRHTNSRMAMALGGRGYVGMYERAQIDITGEPGRIRWTTAPSHDHRGLAIRVAASYATDLEPSLACEPIGGTCISAEVGVSPNRHGVLEGGRMIPERRVAHEVTIDEIDSGFISSFATAQLAPSYLMQNIGVSWTRVDVPHLVDPAAAP